MASDQSETDGTEGGMENTPVRTVARRILGVYFDKLDTTPGFEIAAPALRKRVLDDGALNETAVRAALFGDLT